MSSPDVAFQRYRYLITLYRNRTAAGLEAAWDGLSTHDRADIETYVRQTTPLLTGAKRATVAASAAFFAQRMGVPPVGVSVADIDLEANVEGPFTAHWHALSQGRPYAEALLAGRAVASATGMDFVQSTARRTGDSVAAKSGVRVRWARVPEASPCEFCARVASGSYRTAESADFGHERCGCDVVPA